MADLPTSDLRDAAVVRGVIGFGVCDTEPFDDVRGEIERRKADGLAANLTFTFSKPSRSTDIRSSLPWARRLVVCAAPYVSQAGNPPPRAHNEGRIARFAVQDMYRPLRRTLDELAAMLTERGHRADVLIDDNRLVDRAAAVRAGVGWWGKNTMVLVPGAGPWVLLGSVATDAPLETTSRMVRSCGTCTACLPACPTGALVAPGILDAGRCLAAIAQSPGAIPREHREAMGDRIYGCDDCLDACPPGQRLQYRARPSRVGIVDLIELLRAADRTLLRRYTHFYIPKRDPRYLRRNALVAAGNSRNTGFAGLLAGYLGHPDPLLRQHAAWALARIGTGRASLESAKRRERDSAVIEELELGLAAPAEFEQVR